MGTLVCNTPVGARLLTMGHRLGADADQQRPSGRCCHSSNASRRGSSPAPAVEAFILQHALQVGGTMPSFRILWFDRARRH